MPSLTLPITPGFYDFDAAQIANNGAYIRWMELARGAWLADSPWPLARCLAEGIAPVLTRTEIDYIHPLRLGELIQVHLISEGVGASTWTLRLRFADPAGTTEYAVARQQGCFIKVGAGRVIRMPMELRAYLQ